MRRQRLFIAAAGLAALGLLALAGWGGGSTTPPALPQAVAADIAGRWQLRMQTPAGEKTPVLTLAADGRGGHAGTLVQPGRDDAVVGEVRQAGNRLEFTARGRLLIPVNFRFRVELAGDRFAGTVTLGILPASAVSGTRLP